MTTVLRSLFPFATLCLLASPHPASAGKEKAPKAGGCTISSNLGNTVEVIRDLPLLDLITHPEMYDGCRIVVQGFLGEFDYPHTKLFLSRDDQLVGGSLFGALLISFQQKRTSIDFDQVKRARGDYVLFQGRVFANSAGGHTAYVGEIERFESGGAKHLFKEEKR